MKNILITILMILVVSLLVSHVINVQSTTSPGGSYRDTQGILTFSVRTATYNGPYAPRNAGAIWITNASNQFVKTIKIWASNYRYTLVRWNASSGGNTTGAITGASLNNHQLHNVTWNGANYQGTQQPDGDYKINVEFTEHNATSSNMGKFKQITFTKGPTPVNQTIPNETYFRDMTLVWSPVVVNGTVSGTVTNTSGNPVPYAIIQAGSFSVSASGTGTYSISLTPGTWDLSCTASGYGTQTITGVIVGSGINTEENFVMSAVANSDDLNPAAQLQILPAQPNPFSGQTRIRYFKGSAATMELNIFNMRGQRILHKLVPDSREGWNDLIWDGKDKNGARCPAGTYLLQLKQGASLSTQKLQIVF